jgi:acetyl-CoA synthetase
MDPAFGKFIQDAGVTMLGVVPSIVSQWKNSRCMEAFDWSAIRCFSSTGEVSNPQEMEYLMALGKNKPVIEYCGGTEIGGGYVTGTMIQPNIPGTFSSQALGGEFVLLDEHNKLCKQGEVFLIPPILGLSNSLLNRDHFEVYYKDTPAYQGQLLRRHGDELELLGNGYYKAHGRVDDAMNLGGIKVSSVQIEAVINTLDFIKESAAVAVSPPGGGPSELVIYFTEKENSLGLAEKQKAIKNQIRSELNPLFKVKEALPLEALPRTASGKLMRRNLRSMYEKENKQTQQ